MSSEKIDAAEQSIFYGLRAAYAVSVRPRTVILTGLEYSGKTTMARYLVSHGYFSVSDRQLRSEFALAEYDIVTVLNYGVKMAMQAKVNLVLDAINPLRATRTYFQRTADDNGGNPVTLFMDVPKAVRLQRHQACDAAHTDLLEMEQSELDFELPTPDESPVILDHESTEQQVLRAVGLLPGTPNSPGARPRYIP